MSDRSQLAEAIARALCWSGQAEQVRADYRSRAFVIADELLRASNPGNALVLKHAIVRAVRRRDEVA